MAPASLAYHAPMRRLLAPVLVLGLAAAGATLVHAAGGHPARPLPNLKLEGLDGGVVETDTFRGRPLLLTFWASWCGPCRVELPALEKLYGELAGQGFVLLTVNVDRAPAAAQRFLAATKLSLPVYRLPPQTLATLGIDSLPTNILVGPDGLPAMVFEGYDESMPDRIRQKVQAMVADGG